MVEDGGFNSHPHLCFFFTIRKFENVSKTIDKDIQGKLCRNANYGKSA